MSFPTLPDGALTREIQQRALPSREKGLDGPLTPNVLRRHLGRELAKQPLPVLAEPAGLPQLERLPDPFQKLGGTRLTQRSEWRCRQQEILQQAQKYIYGQKPPKPEQVTGSVTASEIAVGVSHGGKHIAFHAQVVLPPQRQGPFPALLTLGSRDKGGLRLGEELILAQGVAIIFYNQYDLGKEGKPEASRGLANATFLKRERPAAGTLRAGAQGTGELAQWRDRQTPALGH